jgi:hypothetical protein
VPPRLAEPSWTFTAPLWPWAEAPGSWVFMTLPADVVDDITSAPLLRTQCGSTRVNAQIGETRWDTSLFPHRHGLLLPVKATVRRAERIDLGDTATATLCLPTDHAPSADPSA